MGKKKLEVKSHYNFLIWGLVSPFEGHRIAWNLNQCFEFNLVREADIQIENKPLKADDFYAYYLYEDQLNIFKVELIKNITNTSRLVPELKNIDYLLLVKGELDFFEPEAFRQLLNRISVIQSAIEIPINKLKSRAMLITQ